MAPVSAETCVAGSYSSAGDNPLIRIFPVGSAVGTPPLPSNDPAGTKLPVAGTYRWTDVPASSAVPPGMLTSVPRLTMLPLGGAGGPVDTHSPSGPTTAHAG